MAPFFRLGNPTSKEQQRQRQLAPPKMGEVVANEIRKMIVNGELKDGDRLPTERELVEEFGVSRPTLRQAIRILESEALLSIRKGSLDGARVNAPNVPIAARYVGLVLQSRGATLSDMYFARDLLEPAAVRLIAQNSPRRSAQVLREISAKQRLVAADVIQFSNQIMLFHEALISETGSKTLTTIMEVFHDLFQRNIEDITQENIEAAADKKLRRVNHLAQQKLIALIEAGKAEDAEAYWRLHLKVLRDKYLKLSASARTINIFD